MIRPYNLNVTPPYRTPKRLELPSTSQWRRALGQSSNLKQILLREEQIVRTRFNRDVAPASPRTQRRRDPAPRTDVDDVQPAPRLTRNRSRPRNRLNLRDDRPRFQKRRHVLPTRAHQPRRQSARDLFTLRMNRHRDASAAPPHASLHKASGHPPSETPPALSCTGKP